MRSFVVDASVAIGWVHPIRPYHEMALLAFSRLSELASAHDLSAYDAAT